MTPLYIPIEFKNRELGPKLFLINKFIDLNNYKVVFGNSDKIFISVLRGELEPGVVILKSAQRYLFIKLLVLRVLGNKLILLEEESWVPFNLKDLSMRRFPLLSLLLLNEVWLPYEGILKGFTDFKTWIIGRKIRITGHPRINFLGLKKHLHDCKENLNVSNGNKKILVISNFGHLNNMNINSFLIDMRRELGLINYLFYKKEYLNYKAQIESDYFRALDLIQYLNGGNYLVHYRPHPSENKNNFDYRLNDVHIRFDSLEDLFYQDYFLILHFGSTFALDLLTLGLKNVAYLDSGIYSNVLENSKYSGRVFVMKNLGLIESQDVKSASNLSELMQEFRIESLSLTRGHFFLGVNKCIYFLMNYYNMKVQKYKDNLELSDFHALLGLQEFGNLMVEQLDNSFFVVKKRV
jgi:surface carbohydrate biosynthesis protein